MRTQKVIQIVKCDYCGKLIERQEDTVMVSFINPLGKDDYDLCLKCSESFQEKLLGKGEHNDQPEQKVIRATYHGITNPDGYVSKVFDIMNKHKWSAKVLSSKTGIPYKTIQNILHNKGESLSMKTTSRLDIFFCKDAEGNI